MKLKVLLKSIGKNLAGFRMLEKINNFFN